MLKRRKNSLLIASLGLGLVLCGCAQSQGVAALSSSTMRTDPVPFLNGEDFGRTNNGLRIIGTTELTERSYRVFLASEAVSADAFSTSNSITVTLPHGYDASTRYPVIYLLNGSGADGDATQWLNRGNVETVLGDAQAIAVMPDGGQGGWYTNWVSAPDGTRDFSRLHLEELIPWVDGHLPTLATRGSRAIGGVSMGGYGAIHYAQLRPDLFAEAFSMSGILDFRESSTRELVDQQAKDSGAPAGAVFGDPEPKATNPWSKNDPMAQVDALANLKIYLVAGTGTPAENPDPSDPQGLEFLIRSSTETFAAELTEQGITHELTIFEKNGVGCDGGHNWGCWTPLAAELVPRIISGLDSPRQSVATHTATTATIK